jgi:C-terminal processing protease CtpA/Prc
MRQHGYGWRLGVCLALLVVSEASAQAPQPERERVRLERLEALGKLWGQVRYRHPWMISKRIDWDAAFMAAVPKVEAAKSSTEYAAAVQSMLDVLKDPATKVKREEPAAPLTPPTLRPLVSWEKDVLVLDLRNLAMPEGGNQLWGAVPRIKDDVAKARALVVDLRMAGFEESGIWGFVYMVDRLTPLFVEGELVVPGLRGVIHSGYKPQSGALSIYSTSLSAEASSVLQGTPGKKPARIVYLVDEHSYVDPKMLALRAAGRALIVAEGPVSDTLTVDTQDVPLGEKLQATVRTSELVLPLASDVQLPARADLKAPDSAFTRALALANQKGKSPASAAIAVVPQPLWRPDNAYADAPYPSREMRLLAAVRLWNVVQLFFPYAKLMDVDWSQRLPVLLQRFEAAKDAKEYALEVAKASTELRDGHVFVTGHPAFEGILKILGAPFVVRNIEGKAVVTEIYAPEFAQGISVGDVIEKVDGEPIEERARRYLLYNMASTEDAARSKAFLMSLGGAPDSIGTFTVRDAKGVREVKVKRTLEAFQKERPRDPYKLLEGNIGYVNLSQFTPEEVAEMFQKFQGTKGIVFDLRGYPQGTATALAPYLNVKGAKSWARYELPVVAGASSLNGRMATVQEVPTEQVPLYRGRTVTLINEEAISQAEHLGLMLEATCGTTFVGSPTAGANGDVTNTVLPGGITMSFTGLDVRHADGGQLQRKGLTPHVLVRPTIAGLRAGRDEVLERAVRLLKEDAKPTPSATSRE